MAALASADLRAARAPTRPFPDCRPRSSRGEIVCPHTSAPANYGESGKRCDRGAEVPKQSCTHTKFVMPSSRSRTAALTDLIRWLASRLCTKFAGAELRALAFLMSDDQPSPSE